MTDNSQPAQEQHPANLAALQQRLQEIASSPKSTPQEKPVIVQGPVLVLKGK
jgi:hypothetical protein